MNKNSGVGTNHVLLVAALNLNCDVSEFLVLAEQFPVRVGRLWFVRYDRDNGRELARADLPDVKVSNERVAVALDGTTNLIGKVGRLWCAVEQDTARIWE